MKTLNDYASGPALQAQLAGSQFGEDGMITEVFRRMGTTSRFCVEFGAADGLSCSNTLELRQQGWDALLIEADADRFAELMTNAPDQECWHGKATGANIDKLVGGRAVDLMSIDVDGDDWFIFHDMQTRPRLVIIEFNCSVPSGFNVRAKEPGGRFGASIDSLVALAEEKDYKLVGLNHTNAFFVPSSLARYFGDLETDVVKLMSDRKYSVVVTDYDGRIKILTRDSFYWGFAGFCQPCPETLVFHNMEES